MLENKSPGSIFLPSTGLGSGLFGLLPWHARCMVWAHPIKVMEFDVFCMNFKGDWKYIWQLFSLNRYATKEEACVLEKNGMLLLFLPNRFVRQCLDFEA